MAGGVTVAKASVWQDCLECIREVRRRPVNKNGLNLAYRFAGAGAVLTAWLPALGERGALYVKEVVMCDYSLEAYRSRPAEIGEKFTLERFPSGSMGFTAGPICDLAICVPADARLRLEGIGETVQQAYGVGPIEEVVMTRLEGGPYKDAVRFSNGKEVLLQRLDRGLTASIVATEDLIDLPGVHAKPAVPEYA
jgi:hypothetical protein